MASLSNVIVDNVNEISEDPLPTDEQRQEEAWSKFNLLTLGKTVLFIPYNVRHAYSDNSDYRWWWDSRLLEPFSS